jgi:hypothetical protein
MSQQNTNTNSSSNSNVIPVSEVYWSLVDKADKKFSKIRDLPYYQRNRFLPPFSLQPNRSHIFSQFDHISVCNCYQRS